MMFHLAPIAKARETFYKAFDGSKTLRIFCSYENALKVDFKGCAFTRNT
jgi:hypothetical protein